MSSGDLAVGVIGLGFGATHARVLHEMAGVRLAAVCDVDAARLRSVAQERSCPAYDDFEEMLRSERLDAVIVAVPALLHEPVALKVIEAGCPLLVEKPLAPSLAAGRRIARAAEAGGVPLMAAHIERYNPAVQETARRVEAGELGRVVQINARRLAFFRESSRTVDVGVVQDLALHDIDIVRHIAGTEVDHVYAETYAQVRTPYEDGIEGLLRFESRDERAGVVATLEVNWLSPRKVRDLSVLGERGLLIAEYQDFKSASVEFQPAQALRGSTSPVAQEGASVSLGGSEPAPAVRVSVGGGKEPLEQELAAFVAAVRDKTAMPVAASDALAALAIADALLESARTGLPVTPERP